MNQKIFIYLEAKASELKKSAFEIATVARKLANEVDAQVHAVVFGSGLDEALKQLADYGVDKVHYVEGDNFTEYNTHLFVPAFVDILKSQQPSVVLAAATLLGKDLMPRAAALMGVGLASDCTAIQWQDAKLQVQRPVYAGKAFATMTFKASSAPHFATLRPNVFSLEQVSATAVEVEKVSATVPTTLMGELVEVKQGESGQVDLTEADIIVSGGRSLKSAENFQLLFDLADVVGATVGASRAAVDAGYAPHSMQVGQTGKTVSPKLYIAFGISGAIQHLAGMRTSKVIVAINSDPDAPIFKKADYGLVGDLFQLVPEIKKAFAELLSHS